MVLLSDYPQLQLIAWNRPSDSVIDESEALALYERNWSYIDANQLTAEERTFIKHLTDRYGNGCLASV